MLGPSNRRTLALRHTPILLCLALAACGPYPRDVIGTLDRIEQSRRLRVGLTELRPSDQPIVLGFIARLERATRTKAEIDHGPMERQLTRLDEGELDLVLGEFTEDSPWLASVAVIEPLASRKKGERRFEIAPVTRNGENRWVWLIEREVRDSRQDRR